MHRTMIVKDVLYLEIIWPTLTQVLLRVMHAAGEEVEMITPLQQALRLLLFRLKVLRLHLLKVTVILVHQLLTRRLVIKRRDVLTTSLIVYARLRSAQRNVQHLMVRRESARRMAVSIRKTPNFVRVVGIDCFCSRS
jgi:hypothetical protein